MAGNEKNERTYAEDEFVDIGEELSRSWAEIEKWKLSQGSPSQSLAREIPKAEDCPPNSIGRTHPTVGDIMGGRGHGTIGGE